MFYKQVENGIIVGIGESYAIGNNIEIAEEEYNNIIEIARNKPDDTDTVVYKLTTDLVYEPFDSTEESIIEESSNEELSEYEKGYQQALADIAKQKEE